MTDPALAISSDYGRLYRQPGCAMDAISNIAAAVSSGDLLPSITNIIDTESKQFLQQWAANQAAAAAVTAALTYSDRLAESPRKAEKWAAAAHTRTLGKAAELGNAVHNACENLALGLPVGTVPEEVEPFLRAWDSFVTDYSPTFMRVESTAYGTVQDVTGQTLGYAGTADFIATIDDIPLVGDYKTGKGVYDSAAMQLSALANAHSIVDESGDKLEANPDLRGGIVVHLRPDSYSVHPATTSADAAPWMAFSALRRAWWQHAQSSASRSPILLGRKVANKDVLRSLF